MSRKSTLLACLLGLAAVTGTTLAARVTHNPTGGANGPSSPAQRFAAPALHVNPLAPPAFAAALPTPEENPVGDPTTYAAVNLKALDPVYDGKSGRNSDADLMGFYADETTDQIRVRVDLARPAFRRCSASRSTDPRRRWWCCSTTRRVGARTCRESRTPPARATAPWRRSPGSAR